MVCPSAIWCDKTILPTREKKGRQAMQNEKMDATRTGTKGLKNNLGLVLATTDS